MSNFLNQSIKNNIATLIFSRPQTANAFDGQAIIELTAALKMINQNDQIRVVLIKAQGNHFCAGADLKWIKNMADASTTDNHEQAKGLSELLYQLAHLSKPTIALIHGRVMGGGIGLVACCDIVLAASQTQFSLAEVKLGLIPATISPFVIRKIGYTACARYFLTGELFDASQAKAIQLIHDVLAKEALDETGYQLAHLITQNAPHAIKNTKRLLSEILCPIDKNILQKTTDLLAMTSSSSEAQEGIAAFFDKRKPNWI